MKDNKFLSKELIWITHSRKQDFTDKKYDTFFDGKVLQICFYSKGCKYSKCGNCVMCDYGQVRKENLNDVFNNFKKLSEALLPNSLVGALDTEEMPKENIITLLDELSY